MIAGQRTFCQTKQMIARLLLFVFVSFSLCSCWAEDPYSARVIKTIDADTVDVLTDDKQTIRIRLEGIDAPERGQDFAAKARQALFDMVQSKTVIVKPTGRDRYRRQLASLFLDGTRVNTKLVKDGFAWHYTQYNDESELAEAEAFARKHRKGLWSMPNPVAPWNHRKLRRQKASSN
jgi:endonuclease YncB( thermonuclease family)